MIDDQIDKINESNVGKDFYDFMNYVVVGETADNNPREDS